LRRGKKPAKRGESQKKERDQFKGHLTDQEKSYLVRKRKKGNISFWG